MIRTSGARAEWRGHDRAYFRASILAEHLLSLPLSPLRHSRKSGMNVIKTGDAGGFKVPSAIPQDLLLIQNLVGATLPHTSSSSQTQPAGTNDSSANHTMKSGEGDTDSIASSSSEDSSDEEGDVDMLKAEAPTKGDTVDKGAESEEEVEAGLLNADEGGDPMTM